MATRRTRRKLTTDNAHELHRNLYRSAHDIFLAMTWANEHHTICTQCRRRFERMSTPEALRRQVAKRLARAEEAGEW